MDSSQQAFDLLQSGDTDGLRRLIAQNPKVSEARDGAGVSLLMQFIYRGHRELAELIASRKRDVDIFEAAALGRLDRLKECCSTGSDINERSKDGFTALHFACFFAQPDAVRVLIENGAAVDAVATNPMQVTPLHSAASARNLEAARLLIEHGASIDARQHGGWTPIHAAAQNGDRPLVELMLKHHANPTLANDAGKTPAMVAREKGHHELADLLEN